MTDPRMTPNHVRIEMGLSGGAWFGQLHRVDPGHSRGDGPVNYVHVAFRHGLSLDLTRADALRLLTELPAAINRLPQQLPYTGDYSGSTAHLEDQ